MFIGEGPGKNEDLQGEPFVGAAGHNLDALLSKAGLRREDIYIANVVKCRPPGNRNPRPEEIEMCAPFLREQIRSIWPDAAALYHREWQQYLDEDFEMLGRWLADHPASPNKQ